MKIGKKAKEMFKILGIIGLSACLFVGNPCKAADITRATINMQDPNDPMRIADTDAFYVVDVSTTGTNTTNSHVVKLNNIDAVLLQLSVADITVGSVSFSLEQSLDGVTYGSVTASQMIKLTDTLTTSTEFGSDTVVYFAGDYFGTHTVTFGTTTVYGSTSATNIHSFYAVRTMGDRLRIGCNHVLTGTDTGTYKVVIKKSTKGKL